MNKNFDNNGFEYVDLDLPSHTLWATCNVGADKPSDFGLYFQWGDTIGYTKKQIGKDNKLNFESYKWIKRGDEKHFLKYTTEGAKLELEDDAAHVNMGGDWHMPSPKQISELLDNTTQFWEVHNLDDVKGMRFTSKIDSSKSIFIPAAGYVVGGSVSAIENIAGVWSSMLYTKYYVHSAQYLYFYSNNVFINIINRYFGFSVRGVIG